MNIVYIITRSDVLGGASVHLLDLAKGLTHKKHNVHILVGSEGAFTKELEKNNIKFSSLKYLKREISPTHDLLGFLEIRKYLSKIKPDIVHCHSSKAGLLGRLAAKTLGLPVVFTAHGWAFTDGVSPRRQKIYSKLENFLTKFSDHIITVSEYDRQHGFKYKVGTPDLVTTIHNGVPDIANSDRIFVHKENNSVVNLIMVARFEDPKDQYFLIEALSKLPKNLDWKIDFLGEGPNLEKCQELAKNEKLDSKIIFHGQSFKVKEFLNQADIFILISNYEGFPLTILEAMSASLPIIASDVGGVNESVSSENGYLIPKGNIDILVQSLTELIVNKNLRQQLGSNSRYLYETKFSFNTMLEKTFNVYTQVLEKRSLK
ncbi:glycosyltransferase family 4 protein [Acinetobacter indicus]|uniref:glycosyltransferase family 4 protein n=1 Tax=Acinetobacter indicus TaxID=756892 RepID=UPI0025772550|nr:glycosyltransferase family 4 protein [Acinetobacter indicus]MDM1278671.1 glycosyltransferase family 4 protein [Acinetobacter indicus]